MSGLEANGEKSNIVLPEDGPKGPKYVVVGK
jgi:hypothetical protein